MRIRPPAAGIRTTAFYLVASLLCYGASFGITALVLPTADRKLAVLMLSLQYPLLYVLFSLKDAAALQPASVMAISLGYAIVAVGMFGR
ncbi:hypothetical protein [Synechococcus sp. BA-132 BA5]|uniref:hypothetical protein n=1 Tax=Synechococcus sp. BA-132 BA5 TaxID=3110252 RepID=UPI002B203064|nr:hypothetical protein [Synechococcus sp. BA-132 BA5]